MSTITLTTGDGHTLTYDLDAATWALTTTGGKTVASGVMAAHEVTQLRDGQTPREPAPTTDDRLAALEAVALGLARSAAVKDDPELAKAAEAVAAIEATRTREAPVVVEPLPDEPPVKGGAATRG